MTTRRHRTLFHRWRFLALTLLPLALGGCLAHTPEQLTTQSAAVATVPARFYTATIVALPPAAPPPGLYTLGTPALLDPADPATTYATALLQPETKGLRLLLRVDGLNAPGPPTVSYELVTTSGVFRPLADGEWDRAAPQGNSWSTAGMLVFIVPRELYTGQLDIVDYAYPQARAEFQATPGLLAPLVRRTLATFALERLP